MARSPAFHLLGVPVRIDISFLIMAVVLGFGSARSPALLAVWVAVVFVSILWHEMGHALAFRSFGYRPRIELYAMGGLTSAPTADRIPPGRDIAISLAGPGAGLLLGAAVLALARSGTVDLSHPVMETAATDLLWVNIGWGVLNLVPMLPLDGGRVLAALLNASTRGRGDAPALLVSLVVGAGIVVAALANGLTWVALLTVWLGANNVFALQRRRQATRDETLGGRVAEGWLRIERRDPVGAAAVAEQILARAQDDAVRAAAGHVLMWSRLMEGKTDDAVRAVEEFPAGYWSQRILDPAAVRGVGGEDRAIALLRQAFEARPGDGTGTQLARAMIEAGQLDQALALVAGARAGEAGANASALVGKALFEAARYEEAARVNEGGYERVPHPAIGFNAAASWARAGNRDRAIAWLERAVDAGFDDLGHLDGTPHFESLRGTPRYEEIRRRIASDGRAADPASGGAGPTDAATAVDEVTGTTCVRHPGRAARLRCPRCERPACRSCAVHTGAGRICIDCAAELREQPTAREHRGTPGVVAVLVLNGLAFAGQFLLPGLVESFGAVPPAIAAGEWYRLLTPAVLHAGALHLAFNSFALWIYGPSVERAFGSLRFAAVYLVSGFLGGALSYAFGPCRVIGVGASGAIFGLLGALLVYLFHLRRSAPIARSLQGILTIVGINLVIGFTVPGIDNLAHLGGLAGGALVTEGWERSAGKPWARAAVPAAVAGLGVVLAMWRTATFSCPGVL